jgi:hypothetical protein
VVCLILLSVTVYYVGNEQWGRHLTPYKTYLRYAGGVTQGRIVHNRPGVADEGRAGEYLPIIRVTGSYSPN